MAIFNSFTSSESPPESTDAGELVGLRQTARHGNDSDHVPFKTVGELPDAAIELLAALLFEAVEREEETATDD